MSLGDIYPLRCDWPLLGEYLKAQGDPLALDIWVSSCIVRTEEIRRIFAQANDEAVAAENIPPPESPHGTGRS